MQAERDLVQERVIPALRKEARRYGENVGVIDLRWGVDTSTLETQEGAAKVLKVCLDEIERSHPYMLIFLGERYGTMMREDQIQKAVSNRSDKYETNDFIKSITALEVEYGALSEKYGELDRCIVCFRNPVVHMLDGIEKELYAEHKEEGKRKLQELKERIAHDLGDPERLISYSCTWDNSVRQLVGFHVDGKPLEDVLIEAFLELFQEEWKEYESMSWQEKEQLAFRALMESKLHSFVGREQLLERYYQKVVNSTCPLILQGQIGSGKTSIICKLVKRLQEERKIVFSFFAGVGSMSSTAEYFIQQLVYYLEKLLEKEEHYGEKEAQQNGRETITYDDWKAYLHELISQDLGNRKVYIFLDGLEQLQQDEHVKNLDFFMQGEKIQFIISCVDWYKLPTKFIMEREVESIPLLTKEEARGVLKGIFTSYARNTYADIEKEILEKENAGNPLYLAVLIQRLNMLDADELGKASTEQEIVSLGVDVIRNMPDEIEEAFVSVMYNGVDKVSENMDLLQEVLRYLAISRNGLRMQDMQGIFEKQGIKFPVLDFTLLLKYLDSFFYIQVDDRINFANGMIRNGVRKQIDDIRAYEENIYRYIKELPFDDMLRRKEGMYYARIFEDIVLAKALIEAIVVNRKEFLESFVAEGLADEGRFYCKVIESEEDNDSYVCDVFQTEIIKKFHRQRGVQTRVHISDGLLRHMESRYKRVKNDKNQKKLMIAYAQKGRVYAFSSDLSEAIKCYQEAIRLGKELNEKGTQSEVFMELSEYSLFMGNILDGRKKFDEALECYDDSINYYNKFVARYNELNPMKKIIMDPRRIINALANKSRVLIKLERPDDALSCCKEAECKIEDLKHYHKTTYYFGLMFWHHDMGEIYFAKENYDDALEHYNSALKNVEKISEIMKMQELLEYKSEYIYSIAKVYNKLEDYEESSKHCQNAIRMGKQFQEERNVRTFMRKLGSYYELEVDNGGKLGKPEVEGLKLMKELLSYQKKDNEKNQLDPIRKEKIRAAFQAIEEKLDAEIMREE